MKFIYEKVGAYLQQAEGLLSEGGVLDQLVQKHKMTSEQCERLKKIAQTPFSMEADRAELMVTYADWASLCNLKAAAYDIDIAIDGPPFRKGFMIGTRKSGKTSVGESLEPQSIIFGANLPTKNTPIALAMRISMGHPVIFRDILISDGNSFGLLPGLYTDGGTLECFPITPL